jgi:microcompartment protein CcmL/EutN
MYPSKVVIKRPLEDIQVVLTIDKVVENPKNPPLTADEFVLKLTEGTQIQNGVAGVAESGVVGQLC